MPILMIFHVVGKPWKVNHTARIWYFDFPQTQLYGISISPLFSTVPFHFFTILFTRHGTPYRKHEHRQRYMVNAHPQFLS